MSEKYWEYFLSLEDDLERCTKYVDFAAKNYKTFSNEFAKIIMSASAEFENVAKDLCGLIDPSCNPNKINIESIYKTIGKEYPKMFTIRVLVTRYKLTLRPFNKWTATKRPEWWSDGYNQIKHDRTNNFEKANLEYALLSTSGLFVVILYFHQKMSGGIHVDINRAPSLFDLENKTGGANISVTFDVPI